MPYDYVPNPPHTQPGHAPKVGQFSVYEDKEGSTFPGMITAVIGTLPNGNYKVAMRRLRPSASQLVDDPSKLGNPAADEQDGWQYNLTEGRTYWCPCNPPLPVKPCPPE